MAGLFRNMCKKLFLIWASFVGLRLKSTAMDQPVIEFDYDIFTTKQDLSFIILLSKDRVGQSVHLTTLFLGKLEQAVNQYFMHIFSLVTDINPS